jgi:hypothetical protein
MNDLLLHYIWQYQLFNNDSLTLDSGDSFKVIHPGLYMKEHSNLFMKARIQLEDTVWGGNLLVNLKMSDWLKQSRKKDDSYTYVLMHIVWENDEPDAQINRPVFSLKSRVSPIHMELAQDLMNTESLASWNGSFHGPDIPILKEVKVQYEKVNKGSNGLNVSIEGISANEARLIECLHALLNKLKKKPR